MKKLIIANWKLNPLTLPEAMDLASKIDVSPLHNTVLCPPTAFLGEIQYPHKGAQDVFWKAKGAYTGQTSPAALKSLGVEYCIVGHSERRGLGETDEQIHDKIVGLLDQKITPVLCVGFGTTHESDDMAVVDIIKAQIESALAGVNPESVVVAYEPVWAISTGDPYATKAVETSDHAEKVALFLKTKFGIKKVLYGGSANKVNAHGFLSQPHIDGLLVGGASLLADDFNAIINLSI